MRSKFRSTVMPAGEFKAKCLSVLDDVQRRGRSVVVTKRGRPVAQVVPLSSSKGSDLEGTLVRDDDPFSPVDAVWEVNA